MPYHLAKPLSCGAENVDVKLLPPRQVLKRKKKVVKERRFERT